MKRQQNITRFLKLTNSRSVVPSEKPSTSAEDVVEPSVLNSSRKSVEPIEILYHINRIKATHFQKETLGRESVHVNRIGSEHTIGFIIGLMTIV